MQQAAKPGGEEIRLLEANGTYELHDREGKVAAMRVDLLNRRERRRLGQLVKRVLKVRFLLPSSLSSSIR